MLFSIASLALLLPLVSAIAFFIPGEAAAGGPLTISWSDRSRDDPRSVTIKLANPDLPGRSPFDLASNVDISEPGEREVKLPSQIPSDERYIIQFFAVNEPNTVLGSVGPLSVTGGSGGPSSSQSVSVSSSASSASRSVTTASSTTGSTSSSTTSGASTTTTTTTSNTPATSITGILTRSGVLGTSSETTSSSSSLPPTITVLSTTVSTDLPSTPSSAATPRFGPGFGFGFAGQWLIGGVSIVMMLGSMVVV